MIMGTGAGPKFTRVDVILGRYECMLQPVALSSTFDEISRHFKNVWTGQCICETGCVTSQTKVFRLPAASWTSQSG